MSPPPLRGVDGQKSYGRGWISRVGAHDVRHRVASPGQWRSGIDNLKDYRAYAQLPQMGPYNPLR